MKKEDIHKKAARAGPVICPGCRKPVFLDASDVNEVIDPYHNIDGSAVNLKNGRHYNVREDFNKIMGMLAERREE